MLYEKALILLDTPQPFYKSSDRAEKYFKSRNFREDFYSHRLYNEVRYDYYTREIYDLKDILINFNKIKQKSFFKDLDVKTPHILNQTQSLKRLSNLTEFLKIAIFLSRGGKKLRSINMLSVSLFKVLSYLKDTFTTVHPFLKLQHLCYLSNMFYANPVNLPKKLISLDNVDLNYDNSIDLNYLLKLEDNNIENLYKFSIKKFNFLFSFYVYKVDKKIYKNSRGKSGKYTFA